MKKKTFLIIFVFVLVITLLFLCVRAAMRYGYTEGRVLIADNGAYFLILNDHSPIRMADRSLSGGLFSNLQTGDRIAVLHGSIQESYPGRADVYYIRFLEKGAADDIFPDVVQILTELGFFEK